MKKATSILVLALLVILTPAQAADAQYSRTVTATAGTRIRVFNTRTMASSVLVQMLASATPGLGYIYNADPAGACSLGQLVAQLGPSTSTSPGGSYSDGGISFANNGNIDISRLCVDSSVSGATILVSYRAAN